MSPVAGLATYAELEESRLRYRQVLASILGVCLVPNVSDTERLQQIQRLVREGMIHEYRVPA